MLLRGEKHTVSIESFFLDIDIDKFFNIKNKILHMDNINSYASNIKEPNTFQRFEIEAQNAAKLGIKKAIVHYCENIKKEEATAEKLHEDLKTLDALGKKYDLIIHIENTFFSDQGSNIDFFETLFNIVKKQNFTNIGFCFDIGHAKVFSNNNINEWFEFLDYLQNNTISLHFHLHNNQGKNDDHLAFNKANKIGINAGDDFTCKKHYLEVINNIIDKYNSAIQTLETNMKDCLEDLIWLQKELPNYRGI